MKAKIIEDASKNMLQLFVHGANSIIYADKSKNYVIFTTPNIIQSFQVKPEFGEKEVREVMIQLYTNYINHQSSN